MILFEDKAFVVKNDTILREKEREREKVTTS
jgi:hypothetical protein